MKNYRKGNIELREAHTIAFKDKPSKSYWEIVLWYPNGYYNQKEHYEEVKDRPGMLRKKNPEYWEVNFFVHESCFKHPESCYTICSFEDIDSDESPDCKTVGDRFVELQPKDMTDCIDCMKEFYKQWREYYEERRDY